MKKSKPFSQQVSLLYSTAFVTLFAASTGLAKPDSSPSNLTKPAETKSIQRNSDVERTLGQVPSSENILKSNSVQSNTSYKATKTISAAEELKRKQPQALGLGVLRNENLSEGSIKAPTVNDFGAYFRAVSRPEAGNDMNSENYKLGSKSAAQLSAAAQAEQLRSQTMESIQQLLKSPISTDQRVILSLRLAELQVERHAYMLEKEIQDFNQKMDTWKAKPVGQEPVFSKAKSDAQLNIAINSLRNIVNQYGTHPRAPEALFSLGFLLTQTQNSSALLYFERLIQRFPKSQYVPDAYLALGEYYFSKLKFSTALENYKKVLNYKESRAYAYSVYKLGWTHYNLGVGEGKKEKENLAKSLAAFRLVVKLAEAKNDTVSIGLRKDALMDMVLVFAEQGDVETARQYFQGLKEDELYVTLLERLAWIYSERGNFTQAEIAYNRLLNEFPRHAKVPTIYTKMTAMYAKQHRYNKVIETLQAMNKALAEDSDWAVYNRRNIDTVRNGLFANEILAWAQRFHVEAQKTNQPKGYVEALAAYNLYVSNFGKLAKSYDAHFFRAEILLQQDKYKEAADGYLNAVALDQKFQLKGKYTKDALLNTIFAIDRAASQTAQPKLPAPGMATAVVEMQPLFKKLMFTLDTFVSMFPADKKALPLEHRAASIVFAHGDYANANVRWTKLVAKAPESEEAFVGARLVLKSYIEKKNWATTVQESRKFLAIPRVANAKLGKSLYPVLRGALFQHALVLEKDKKYAEAAQVFVAYQKEFPQDADAPVALFNAASNGFKLGRLDDSIQWLKILMTSYPNSNLGPHATFLIANSYDTLAQFAQSADYFEQLAAKLPKDKSAPEAIWKSAQQRAALQQYQKSNSNIVWLTRSFPNTPYFSEATLLMADNYLALNQQKEAENTLSGTAKVIQKNFPAEATLMYGRAAQISLSRGKIAQSEDHIEQGLSVARKVTSSKRNPVFEEGLQLLGITQVMILDRDLVKAKDKKIQKAETLTAEFTQIKGRMEKLAQRYLAVAKLGNAEAGVAALYRVAEMQEFLAHTLLTAPSPEVAKPEEVTQYRSTLEQVALPLQEEATQLYLTAWRRAQETEALTPYVAKIYERLTVLRPTEYKTPVEDMPTSKYFSSTLALTSETSKLGGEK